MPKIEKDLLKVKGSDGQWHYVPAVGGSVDTTPTWDSVQNKPFSTLGGGLEVDENGVLSAQGGGGGSANAVQYVAQTLTDEQKAQARENIGAKAATDKSAYIISKTRSYGYIHTDGMDFDGVYAQIQSGKVVMLLVDDSSTYYGVIHPASGTGKKIVFYNIADISDSGGRNKGIEYFGFTWRKGDDSLTEWWGDIPRVVVDSTLTESGSAADAKAVGDELAKKLDKNQGAGNAGKILGIGEDGIVVPQDIPQGGDNSLGITAAAVGQTIKVKSVDTAGKPTEWEAADLSSGDKWETVREITIPESVEGLSDGITYMLNDSGAIYALKFTTDANGNNLNYKKLHMLFMDFASTTQTTKDLGIIFNESYITDNHVDISGLVKNDSCNGVCDVECLGDNDGHTKVQFATLPMSGYGGYAQPKIMTPNSAGYGRNGFKAQSIVAIIMRSKDINVGIKPGGKIFVYGVRA